MHSVHTAPRPTHAPRQNECCSRSPLIECLVSSLAPLARSVPQRAQEACESLRLLSHTNKIRVRRGRNARGGAMGSSHQSVTSEGSDTATTSHNAADARRLLVKSLHVLHDLPPVVAAAGPVRVRFIGEEGLDAGGLAKDWVGLVARALLSCGAHILEVSRDEHQEVVKIDPRGGYVYAGEDLCWLFRGLGRFLAKVRLPSLSPDSLSTLSNISLPRRSLPPRCPQVLRDGHTLGITLSPILLLQLAGREPSLPQLAQADPYYYKGLKWILENDVTDLDLTFSTTFDLAVDIDGDEEIAEAEAEAEAVAGNADDEGDVVRLPPRALRVPPGTAGAVAAGAATAQVCKELVPGGRDVAVTESNKAEYVRLMQTWLSRGQYEPAVTHLVRPSLGRHLGPCLAPL